MRPFHLIVVLAFVTSTKLFADHPASENFGPFPGQSFWSFQCEDPSNLNKCRLPSHSEIQKEIDLFAKLLPHRREVIQGLIVRLIEAGEKVKTLMTADAQLPSNQILQKMVQVLTESGEQIHGLRDIILNQKFLDEPLVVQKLKALSSQITKFDEKIAAQTDPEVKVLIQIEKNKKVSEATQGVMNTGSEYEYVDYFYFANTKEDPLSKVYLHIEPPFVEYKGYCQYHIGAALTLIYSHLGQKKDNLSVLEELPIIRKLWDRPNLPLKAVCENKSALGGIFRRGEYNLKTNTIINDYERVEKMFAGTFWYFKLDWPQIVEEFRKKLK